jgi:hypothetical protein
MQFHFIILLFDLFFDFIYIINVYFAIPRSREQSVLLFIEFQASYFISVSGQAANEIHTFRVPKKYRGVSLSRKKPLLLIKEFYASYFVSHFFNVN